VAEEQEYPPNDRNLAGLVFISDNLSRFNDFLARKLNKVRLLFVNERRAVLGAKAHYIVIVASVADRAIFH
jgi:hypothetical protein